MVYNTDGVDIKAYIESGILESVILGEATEQEVQEVRCLSHIYPEIKTELEQIRAGYENQAIQESIAPNPALKARVMDAIRNEKQEALPKTELPSESKIVSLNPNTDKNSSPWKWAVAASLVLTLGLGTLWVLSMSDAKQMRAELAALEQKKQQDDQIMMAMQVEQERMQDIQKVLTLGDLKTVVMNGMTKDPKAEVHVMWSPGDKKAVMVAEEITPAPANMQYQLWAIVDGTPKSMGVFTYDDLDNMTEPFAVYDQEIEAFAITLEKMGGNPTPTMEMMVVMGELASK